MSEIKAAKEQFVTGLEGTTLAEICWITAVIPTAMLFRRALFRRSHSPVQEYLLDFTFYVMPNVCVLLLDLPVESIVITTNAVSLAVLGLYSGRVKSRQLYNILQSPHKPFVSTWRATMMITTCTCILAVDFHAFPRRFAKAETFGTGLMDVGVGSFVLANAVVSGAARKDARRPSPGGQLLQSLPLLLLGSARLLTTLAADYQVHVGEYGVHWNFFFTLAGVAVLTAVAGPLLPPHRCAPAGAALALAHQYLLSSRGLSSYLMSDTRGANLLSQNKEGICSLPGYLALYLLGVGLGQCLFGELQVMAQVAHFERILNVAKASSTAPSNPSKPSKPSKPAPADPPATLGLCLHLALKMVAADVVLWMVTLGAHWYVEPISRRSANLAYVVWMVAYNLAILTGCLLVDLLAPAPAAPSPPFLPPLVHAITFNLLPVFLLANVVTGAVNMSVNTLEVGDSTAFAVVAAYMAAVCLLAAALHACNVKLKL